MPVKRDPFKVPAEEVTDFIKSVRAGANKYQAGALVVLTFQRQERIFASTDGAYATQTIYTSLGATPHTSDFRSLPNRVRQDGQRVGRL